MTTRKYKSPLGRDIGLNKATNGKGWKGLKGQAALALAVSLWIAGGGVAGATGPANIYILSDGSVNIKDTIKDKDCVGTMTVSADKKTLSIGGTWSSPTPSDNSCNGYYIYARNATLPGQDTGYTLSVNGATFNNVGYLTMYGVANGQRGYPLSDNHVVITDSKFIGDATIYGGYVDSVDTIQNTTITIAGTLDANGKPKTSFSGGNQYIYTAGCNATNPGSECTFSNNTINLYGAAAMESVTFNTARWNGGIAPSRNNNELHLGGTKSGQTANGIAFSAWQGYNADGTAVNNTVKKVSMFDKIVLHKVKWDTDTPALKATGGFTDFGGGLDISGMTFEGTPAGRMTLLEGTEGNFSTLNLTYSGGAATLNNSTNSQIVKTEASKTSTNNGVTLGYNPTHTVSIADTSKVTYNVVNYANKIALGTITWNQNGIARALTAGDYTFNDATVIDTSSFEFNTPSYIGAGDSMTLLSNATGLTAGDNIAHSQSYTNYDNCIKLNATLNGNITKTADTLGYIATGTTLDSVDLANWNGTTTAVPTGWTSNLGANSVKAADFTAPNINAGTSKNILTTNTGSFFNDNQITGVMKYAAQASSTDTANGVALTGSESKGVKASTDGKNLVYARSNFEVSSISLGTITWNKNGTARALTAGDYTFNNSTVIDTSSFEFNTPSYLGAGDSMTLLSNATGLTAGDNIAHSQSYTNYDNCIKLNATLTGNITKTENTLGYTAEGTTLDSVDLANWNGTTTEVPAGWTSNLGANSVKAAGFTAPNINAGTSKNILTTNTGSFFNDNQITGVMKYAAQASSIDTAKGVALTGSESKGVKATDDGKSLVYARSNFNVNNVSLGEMTWGEGRALTGGYDFAGVTNINAANLKFTNPDAVTGSGTLLTGATNLATGDSNAHTQTFNKTINGATLSATLSGNVTRATAGQIGYTATGTALKSINLTGWNGTTGSVPTGWTSALGANSITATNFAPNVAAGTTKDILTATTNDFFAENQIAEAIKYKAQASSTDTANGVALTGSESKGVKTADNGTKLVYARSNKNVSNISFGTMKWDTSRTANTGYDFTNANIDFSMFTFSNPESISAGGTTTLLVANNTLKAIDETEKNVSYAYSPIADVTVNGIVNGSYKTDSNAIKYTATANNATKLTFGNVVWKDSGALINHATTLSNVSFDGAAVDTSNIYFTNIKSIEDNKQMTLVSDFGTSVGTISGTSFGIGTEKGEGHAFYENNNLRYLVTKGIGNSQASSTESVSGQTETVGNEAKVNFSVIGAMTGSGRAESNKATVSDKSEVTGNVVGAETSSGVVDKNEANVIGNSQINGNVEAAKTNSGSATANTANVESSKVTGSTVGAVTDNGLAIGNVASVTSGSVGTDVAGAQSTSGTVSNGNTAKVQSAEVGGSVYGGKSTSGEVNSSIANVSGGSVKGSVYGGSTDGAQKAEKNEVKLENDAKVHKGVYGGHSGQGIATGNKVTIDGAAVAGTVYGGKSQDKSDNNSVELDNGTVGAIVGGGCEEASGNIVTITGGEVLNGVYGAKAGSSATNNTITMSGGKVNDILYGGYADSATGITTSNTVTLYGTADVSNAGVFGGNGSDITGNVLNIGTIINDVAHSWSGGGQSVKNVANFETMNFVSVPWNKEKAAVTISDGTASDLSGTKVNATTVHFTDTTSLKQGDTMTLLDEQKVAADKRVQTGNITKESEYTAGSTLKGTGILSMDDSGNVIYKVTDKDSSDQSHNTVMGATASMAALSAGNDFVGSAVEGLGNSNNTGSDGLATYANLGGGSMNVETGSHVKTHTWNAILAIGHRNKKKLSTTEYGAFFEYGTGNYSTFNGDERGDGSTRYTGGGILGKWQKNNGFYVEGSLRAGSIHDDANNVLRDVNGNPYSYTTDATYWGAHIGVGREIKLNKTAVLDLYAKYFYNHRGSVSFDAGGHYYLGAVESSVLRVGTRYTVKQNDNINYYGGLAVEHEFCGRASGFADGVAIRGADISGTSVRGEIGATFRPGEKSNVTLDLNLSGFAGKKHGLTGGLSAVFHI